MFELTRAQEWLYQRLLAAPALNFFVGDRIFEEPAPQDLPKDEFGSVLPYILIDHRAGTDITVQKLRVGSQLLFAVEVVSESASNLAVEPIYDAIDTALQGKSGTNRGLIIDQCQRDSNYSDWGVESGKPRKHVGALWRLFLRVPA